MQIKIAKNDDPNRTKQKPLFCYESKKHENKSHKGKNSPPERRTEPLKITMPKPSKSRLIAWERKRNVRVLTDNIFVQMAHTNEQKIINLQKNELSEPQEHKRETKATII
jgi:hypothetical protein